VLDTVKKSPELNTFDFIFLT